MELKRNSTRLLAVDDFEPFRRFACLTLSQTGKFQIVGQASDGLEAIQKAEELQPDLILLDIGLPKLDGIESARQIRQVSPRSKILFLSGESDPDIVLHALDTGGCGYVQKLWAEDDLVPAVEAVLEGKQFVSHSLKVPVFDIFSGPEDTSAVWVETVAEMSQARERMEAIAQQNRARHFVISRISHSIVARTTNPILEPELAFLHASNSIIQLRAENPISMRAWIASTSLLAVALILVWIAVRPKTVSTPTSQILTPLASALSPDTSRKSQDSASEAAVPSFRRLPFSQNTEDEAKKPTAAHSVKSGERRRSAIPSIRWFARPAKSSATATEPGPPASPPLVVDRTGLEAFPMSPALSIPPAFTAPLIRAVMMPPDFALDRTIQAHSSWVTSVAFSTDGQRLASGSWDQTVKLWDVSTGQELSTVGSKVKEVQTLAFSPDGHLLATENSNNTVVVWDARTGLQVRSFSGNRSAVMPGSAWVYSIAFSPDGRWLASAVDDKTVRIWNVRTGEKVRDFTALRRSVMYTMFSPDGRWLASGDGDKNIEIWDVFTGQVVERLSGHKKLVYALAFSPDGRLLASASADKTIKLWDTATGRNVRSLGGHQDLVTSVCFSVDGRWLASGSWDQTVKIWNVETGSVVQTLNAHKRPIYTIAFDSSGRWLASGSEDGVINLWQF